jgi:hypothetical protein
MDHNQPGLYLSEGPPLTFEAIFRDDKVVKKFCYEMTPEQAAELGTVLLRLAAASANMPHSAKRPNDGAFLALEVN